MSDQPTSGNNNNNSNNNRRHNNQRRRPQGPGQNSNPNPNQNRDANSGNRPRPQHANQSPGPLGQAQAPREGGSGGGQRRRHGRNNSNRPRNPNHQGQPGQGSQGGPGQHGNNIERIYEKYLNLLDQHLIARRKFHDLFYRADPAQKNKLERNFYNSLHDIREFENRLTPEARALFEKRNNGLKQDNIYTTNHELPLVGETPPPETEWADPHFLQTQKIANYVDDKEESVGSAEDYLRYKNLL